MNEKSFREIIAQLSEPFDPSDLEWRLQWHNDDFTSGLAVPYVTNRAIQNRLDEVVGPENWQNEYRQWHDDQKGKKSQLCGIAIFYEQRKEWLWKWDGAEDSEIESVKGGLSDSMKRAAVQWGIGRILYSLEGVFVDTEKKGKNAAIIKRSERDKLDNSYLNMLKKLGKALPKAKNQGKASSTSGETDVKTHKNEENSSVKNEKQSPAKPIYIVIDKKLQPSTSGEKNSNLRLKNQDGNIINAFIKGESPDVTQGTKLYAKLSRKANGSIVYHTVDQYEIAA